MRVVLVFAWVVVAAVSGYVEIESPINYHQKVGIPLAARIKADEELFLRRSATSTSDEKIVGGVTANQISHPYLAGLVINFSNVAGQSVCGSSLLTTNRLVTAAHCWFDGINQGSMFTVVLGSQFLFFGGTRITTTTVVMHPQWTTWNLNNDIAIIYLPTSVLYTQNIQPIALPTQLSDLFVGEIALASGYGKTSDQQVGVSTSTTISQVYLPVITVAQCQAIFGSSVVQGSTLCTSGIGGVGICGGDSGGPLVINRNGQNILVGVSSFVASNQCQGGFPSGFARVTSFYSFIVQHL